MKRFKTPDDFFEAQTQWQDILLLLREILLTTELEETIKWGAPTYTVCNKNVVGIGAFKNYVGLWFFNGALLSDPDQVLINAQEGKTKALRQWRFTNLSEVKKEQVLRYVNEAIENQKRGLEIKPQKKEQLQIPQILNNALQSDSELANSFNALPPYKQREYIEHIGTAKREATKQSRLEKSILLIKQGLGLHDKYR